MPSRFAMIITCGEYNDNSLRPLSGARRDSEELQRILADPDVGGFEVHQVHNRAHHEALYELDRFVKHKSTNDVLFVHFSCHGIKDVDGRLYFAAINTETDALATTAIPAAQVHELLTRARPRQKVLILDCCYGGAYLQSVFHRGNERVNVLEQFPAGRGFVIISAADKMQYAFEGSEVKGIPQPSVFTSIFVAGLCSSEADGDKDGYLGVGELFRYVQERIQQERPEQTPVISIIEGQDDIAIARVRSIKGGDAAQERLTGSYGQSSHSGVPEGVLGTLEKQVPNLMPDDLEAGVQPGVGSCTMPTDGAETQMGSSTIGSGFQGQEAKPLIMIDPQRDRDADSRFYVARETDFEALQVLHTATAGSMLGQTLIIKGPWQVGKSMLLGRLLREADHRECRIAHINMTDFTDIAPRSISDFYPRLFGAIYDDLGVNTGTNALSNIRDNSEATKRFEQDLLAKVPGPLIIGLDRLECTFNWPIRDQFLRCVLN